MIRRAKILALALAASITSAALIAAPAQAVGLSAGCTLANDPVYDNTYSSGPYLGQVSGTPFAIGERLTVEVSTVGSSVIVLGENTSAGFTTQTSGVPGRITLVMTSTLSQSGDYAHWYVASGGPSNVSWQVTCEAPAPPSQDNDAAPAIPTAAIQQFARAAGQTCDRAPDDFVDLPALSSAMRNDAWGASWARWPNAGTGGYVCTRQPYYTGNGTWAVR